MCSLRKLRINYKILKIFSRHSSSVPKPKIRENTCIISCKRSKFDYYMHTVYNKLDEIPLASKGWTHNKSKGDFFTVHPFCKEDKETSVSFTTFGFNPALINALKTQNIEQATEFQREAMPLVGDVDKHLMLAAETGCGKTLSYLLPIIQNLMGRKNEDLNSPRALILVPNRELAYQIGETAKILCEPVNLKVQIIVGGNTKKIMMNPDFSDIDILVGSPGAVGKLSTVGVYKLNNVIYTVLDEADTLIDDSFIERMTGILKRVTQSKIILVSATLPKRLPDILKPIEPTLRQIISPKLHKPLLNITQKFLRMTRSAKPGHLLQIAKENKAPLLVFTNRNQTCNWLALFLRENGVTCSNINGDMNYAIRINQWNQFIRGETKILSATDVGSRGLDTTQVKHVLNYDFPLYAADYLHRIGRIGRLGSGLNCKATNFISGAEEAKLVQQIEVCSLSNKKNYTYIFF